MHSIVNILEDFEKLAYKILIWVILIPKTIVKIILNPSFAPGYIHDELEHDKASPFDEYMSPMLLYLGVTLVPALIIYFLPSFGLSIVRPEEFEVTGRTVEFEAESIFKSDTSILYHQFDWMIWQECGVQNAEQGFVCEGFEPRFIKGQRINEYEGVAALNKNGERTGGWQQQDSKILFGDGNAVTNLFTYEFTETGIYRVDITASNFREERPDELVELYPSSLSLYVPSNPEQPIEIYSYYSGSAALTTGLFLTSTKPSDGDKTPSLEERFESGETIFLGLALLLPPLLFALAAHLFQGREKSPAEAAISESSLKENFYAQCYYFVPVGLTFWAGYYSDLFYTNDLHFDRFWLLAPYLIVFLWFVSVEINALANSSELTRAKKWISPVVVLFCLVVLVGAVFLYDMLLYDMDTLRKSSIWSYPLVVAALIVVALYLRIKRWIKAREKTETHLSNEPS